MKRFIIEDQFWEVFPEAKIGTRSSIEAFKSALNELTELVNQNLGGNYKISVLDSVQKEIVI